MTKFRLQDLQSNEKQAYVLIQNKVYDISDFIPAHPGGDVILTHVNGEDATDVFNSFHPPSAYEVLANYYVGDLHEQDQQKRLDKFAEEIEKLRLEFYEKGLFESNKLYYLYKVLFNYSILACSVYLLQFQQNYLLLTLSAVLMGIFWQQSGWLSHDFLHHQVFRNRTLNNAMGYLLGNVGQGFSVSWWKNKHNSHHAAPNIHGQDPDIDTMPFLGWSEHALEYFEPNSFMSKFLIYNQHYFYFLLLTFARLSWCQQSVAYNLDKLKEGKITFGLLSLELGTIALHWTLYLGTLFYYLSPAQVLLYILGSQATCGFLLALVFSLNHNGMPIYSQQESTDLSFYRKQILTGRNIYPSLLNDWLTGGLNYQIEHHLFPSLPRHRFYLVQPRVKQLCKEFGVAYHVTGIYDGTAEVLGKLRHVADKAKERKFE